MKAILERNGNHLWCRMIQSGSTLPPGSECRIPLEDALPWVHKNAECYARARENADDAVLYKIGRNLFDGLNQATGWAANWIAQPGPRFLEVRIDPAYADATIENALQSAPWELLADDKRHLIDDVIQAFGVARRIGVEGTPYAPTHRDFYLAFMAAAPEGAVPLDYEAEEAAILKAAETMGLSLFVEESGALIQLRQRLSVMPPESQATFLSFSALNSSGLL